MKKIISLITVFAFSTFCFGQTPEKVDKNESLNRVERTERIKVTTPSSEDQRNKIQTLQRVEQTERTKATKVNISPEERKKADKEEMKADENLRAAPVPVRKQTTPARSKKKETKKD